MKLDLAKEDQVEVLVKMSKAAFDSDVEAGADSAGGPPDYDSIPWHMEMARQKHLYALMDGNEIIGGALLFTDPRNRRNLYVGRIFVDKNVFRKGYGTQMMDLIEQMSPDKRFFFLDTPIWNIRTNSFYKKIGYHEVKRDDEFVYYKKENRY